MKLLERMAQICAIVAGLILTVITLMTCASLIGRNTIGWTVQGDFELTGVAAGAAIALFMPLCQLRRGNIIVDFFTSKASSETTARLDRFGALLMALMMALLAWRSVMGGLNSYATKSTTMMMGFPEWIVFLFIVPGLALTAAVAATQAFGPDRPALELDNSPPGNSAGSAA